MSKGAQPAEGEFAGSLARAGSNLGVIVGVLLLAVAALAAFAWYPENPDSLWGRAEAAFQARDFDSADALLKRLARARPLGPIDLMLRAQVAMGLDRIDEALADLAAVPDDFRMAAKARLQAGQLELRRSRFPAAEAQFLKAIALNPKEVQARRELVYIYGMQLRRPELNAMFQALAEYSTLTYPEVFLWCLSRGVSWESSEIVATLGRCLEADPTDRWARLGRAEGLRELSRFDEAEATLAPLPASDPDARAARVRLALARGEDEAAEALLDGGPADHSGLALLRGQLALVRNDAVGALRHFRIAHDLAPSQRETIFGLGQALQMAGDEKAAAPYLESARKYDRLASLIGKAAIESNRKDPTLMLDLGAACLAIGRIPEAAAWYQLAVDRDPLDVKAQQALTRLRSVGK